MAIPYAFVDGTFVVNDLSSVAEPDPVSGVFLTPGSGIRDG